MKRLIIFLALFYSISGMAQTCEEREGKLLELNGSLSAGFMYNTYAVIGSLVDGYSNDVYDKETIMNLLGAQKKMSGNMVEVLEKTIADNILKDQDDKDYINTTVTIIRSFTTQIDLYLKYIQNKTQKNLNAYQSERTNSWKQLSKLMGIED